MSTRIQQLVFLFLCFILHASGAFSQHIQQKVQNGLFVENKGQWKPEILYRSDVSNGHLYIEKDRFLFNFWEATSNHKHSLTDPHKPNEQEGVSDKAPRAPKSTKAHSYEVRFLGCNPVSASTGESPAEYTYNYFKGSDKSKWASNVHGYASATLQNVYPNTSLKCIGKETGFKYEFHLQTGANAAAIRLQYSGVDSIYLQNGALNILTSLNHITEEKPFSYQVIEGRNIEVKCAFKLTGHVISFVFPDGYNKKYPLVIDPQLIFSTYTGSLSDNWGNTATYDEEGNAYVAGIVYGVGYPVTLGAYQTSYKGNASLQDPDLGIMKFTPTGTLIYATYLGGELCDIPSSLIVNKKNQLVILGITGSTHIGDGYAFSPFPTTAGSLQPTFKGGSFMEPTGPYEPTYFYFGSDLFVSILSTDGSSLVASTFIGGSGNDGLSNVGDPMTKNYGDQFRGEVALDAEDNIYISHKTSSSNIADPTIPGYDKSFGGALDGYAAKLKPDLSAKIWDTYIGGSSYDAAYSLYVKSDHTLYVSGGTKSANMLGSATGGIKTKLGLNDIDGFIMHLSADGSSLLHATYIGTSSYDQSFYIQLDNEENVYVFGQTQGNYPKTDSTYGQEGAGQFIQKLNPELNTSLMSTTFGNYRNQISIVPTAFLVNDCGNIMLSGWGGYVNQDEYAGGNTFYMPLTSDAYQKVTDGSDFYIMVLKKDATELLYATYFGGYNEADHVDGGTSRFDKKGIIYQSVCASCYLNFNNQGNTSNFPTTPNAHSIDKGAYNCNNAIFKFDLTKIEAAFDVDTSRGCAPLSVKITNKSIGKNSHWDFGDGTTSDLFNPLPHSYTKAGTYTIRLIVTDLTTCIGRDTAEKIITIYPLPGISIGLKDTAMCKGDTISLLKTCNPTWTYQWSPTLFVQHPDKCDALFSPVEPTLYTVTVTDTNGCVKKDSATIHIATLIAGIDWENLTDCRNGKPTVRVSNPSTGPLTYFWTFGDGNSSSSDASPIHQYAHKGSYQIVVDISFNDDCHITDKEIIDIDEVKIPNLFTPNNDALNDCFEILGLYPKWDVEVYNIWGKRIFKNENYNNDFCGEGLSTGVYYYLVCPPNGDCCKNWVHILY